MDFFVILTDDESDVMTNSVIMLSNDLSQDSVKTYYMHYFYLKNDLITWQYKTEVKIEGYQLRDYDPLINFDMGNYVVFIDKSEQNLFFVSNAGETLMRLNVKKKVQNLDVC